ncbi:hypothetical protein [Ruminococcus flavefaciens]|uniref:hypothetical protein n=1 Tax=Ruminococcus flavefaciens TaxID=1265 RepID=UPI00048F88C5|nr:hypothetical protein [Ruminococcus flavefaciens]
MQNNLLVGNGLDIQLGGFDYLNKWIIARMLAKAKMGKYDSLFNGIISGDEIVELFCNMPSIARDVQNKKYDTVPDKSSDKKIAELLKSAIMDFRNTYSDDITSIEQLGMEDIILMFQIYLLDNNELLPYYKAAKQGYCQMLLDAIYCEGKIQTLSIPKAAKCYFLNFDNIFSLNYDNSLEKSLNRKVLHLHGDYKTIYHSENHKNALGYFRHKNKTANKYLSTLKQCNCNGILDFSGDMKYSFATTCTQDFKWFENVKKEINSGKLNIDDLMRTLQPDQREMLTIGIEKDLYWGDNYYFDVFENMTGKLTIIGLAPNNDSHIFKCINKSNVENVIFYRFGNESEADFKSKLKITKPVEIRDVKQLWVDLHISQPDVKKITLSSQQYELVNAFCPQSKISFDDLLKQINSIPTTTRRIIFEMMKYEISKEKYHVTPATKEEQFKQFISFGKTLEVSSLSPQALCVLYLNYLSK